MEAQLTDLRQTLETMRQGMQAIEAQVTALNTSQTTVQTEIATRATETVALRDAVQRLRADSDTELANLKGIMAAGIGTLPDLVNKMKSMKASSSTQSESIIDSKGIGKPFTFTDKEDKFTAWQRKVESFLVSKSFERCSSGRLIRKTP